VIAVVGAVVESIRARSVPMASANTRDPASTAPPNQRDPVAPPNQRAR
jgi:hypothetical protein